MPDLSIITCYTCPDNIYFSKSVTGSNGNSYVVSYRSEYGWECTCPAFKFKQGKCKHIQQVESEKCNYNIEAWAGSSGETQDGNCPDCGQELSAIRVGV